MTSLLTLKNTWTDAEPFAPVIGVVTGVMYVSYRLINNILCGAYLPGVCIL